MSSLYKLGKILAIHINMKQILIIILMLPFFVLGQNKKDSKGRKQGPWEVKFEDSEIIRYKGQFKDDKPFGTFHYYYPDGKLSAVSKYEDGGIVARTTMFDIEGTPMGYGKFINQKKDSTWTYFVGNTVANREEFKNGKRHGKKIVYYDSGRVYEETSFENGLEHGPYNMYYENKQVKINCNYVDGNRDGKITYYFSNGSVEAVGFYKNAVKNGIWRYYDHRGVVTKEILYKNDKILLEGQDIKEELDRLKAEGKI